MKPVAQPAAATVEMEEAAAWYEREAGMGDRIFTAVNLAKSFVRRHPQLGTPHRRGTRKWPVKRFPYLVITATNPTACSSFPWLMEIANRDSGKTGWFEHFSRFFRT